MSWKHEDIQTDIGILRITGDTSRLLIMVPSGSVLRWNGVGFRFHGCWNISSGSIGELDSWILGPGPVEGHKGEIPALDDSSASDALFFVEEIAQEWLDDEQSKQMLEENARISPVLKEDPDRLQREIEDESLALNPEHADTNPYAVMEAMERIVDLNRRYQRTADTL